MRREILLQGAKIPADQSHLRPSSAWWAGAAIYQIYPRSFADSNGDGIGDLSGLYQRLDHIASLGVEAIWISPFFTSPMRDFGYDVSDFCNVDPIFGTLDDFDSVVRKAHSLGLKVLIDQVYAHTSDEHSWFVESRSGRINAKADWYVWHDPKPDGSPPNNWQSVFGGPAWSWDARRCQYYMHNFLSSQPQLNVHNRKVQDALLAVARFWLERGVDGFRLDALNFAMYDPQFRDNPPLPDNGRPRTRPFDYQIKKYNQSHADIVGFIEQLRRLADGYGAIFTMAEVGGDNAIAEMHAFTRGDARLNSAYGFDFLYAEKLTPGLVCKAMRDWPEEDLTGWPSWAFENHDAPRALSRWCAPEDQDRFARLKIALLICLRGNIILYQGEELGLTQVDIGFDQLQDPEAIANWPLTLSRDGARTPMPWLGSKKNAGFSEATPWLPLGTENIARAVDMQEADPASLLNLTRQLLALRRTQPALREGSLTRCDAQGDLLILERQHGDTIVECCFNLGHETLDLPASEGAVLLAMNEATPDALPAFSVLLRSIDRSARA